MQDRCAITVVDNLAAAAQTADIIVTATGTTRPLIKDAWGKAGTHITAVGADEPGKQELEPGLVKRADILVADSIDQCLDHGELSHVFKLGLISCAYVEVIGAILSKSAQGRTNVAWITIDDLTGIAAQDIAIAGVVLDEYRKL